MTNRTGHHNYGIAVSEPATTDVYRRSGHVIEISGFAALKEGQTYVVVSTNPLRLEEIFPEKIISQLGLQEFGGLKINFSARKAFVSDAPLILTKTEWKILEVLFQNKGNLVSYAHLIKDVWGLGPEEVQLVRVWVSRIRAKIPGLPIQTITGQGLRLDA